MRANKHHLLLGKSIAYLINFYSGVVRTNVNLHIIYVAAQLPSGSRQDERASVYEMDANTAVLCADVLFSFID